MARFLRQRRIRRVIPTSDCFPLRAALTSVQVGCEFHTSLIAIGALAEARGDDSAYPFSQLLQVNSTCRIERLSSILLREGSRS